VATLAQARSSAVRRTPTADARISIRDALSGLGASKLARQSRASAYPEPKLAATSGIRRSQRASDARGAILHTVAATSRSRFYTATRRCRPVKNWVRLAERGWFNGSVFHRVVPNFVIQDGDPTGTGSSGPGYTIRCEYKPAEVRAGHGRHGAERQGHRRQPVVHQPLTPAPPRRPLHHLRLTWWRGDGGGDSRSRKGVPRHRRRHRCARYAAAR
jgi:hypothetical protein